MAKMRILIFSCLIVFATVHGSKVCTYSKAVIKTRVETTKKTACDSLVQYYYNYCRTTYRYETRLKYYTTTENYYDCCTGYKKTQHSGCEPVCTPQCTNSKCMEPDYCECYQGYKKGEAPNVCTPVCSLGCTNSECTAPEVCKCFDGYGQNDSSKHVCNPICTKHCVNSTCTAPEKCTCFVGHQKHDNYTCTPVCSETCINSECTAPETCTCLNGYKSDNTNKYSCEPVCNKECVNGKCVAPDTCLCSEGFKNDASFDHICVPVCSEKCGNSVCTAPELCTCLTGYKTNPHNKYMCEPVCSKNCGNGNCTAPETCTCFPGYTKHSYHTNICFPICTQPCDNGTCVAPEVCKCNEGFTNSPEFTNKCQPYCSDECINANCTLPETCSCWDGYKPDSNNSCIPVCSKLCENGLCSAPETCTCLEGYVLHKDDPYLCIPFCSDCENGHCSEYETCSCFHGYGNVEDNSTCSPVCKDECVNGFCSLPNICSCYDGYRISSNKSVNVCSPSCSLECINGNCTEPEICECFDGYVPNEDRPNVCQPLCSLPCVNGTCSQPERCSCFWGFSQDINDSFKCSLYEEETGCKAIQVLKPLLKYSNESCFHTDDYILASFAIEDCNFIHIYLNKYILQNNGNIYDKSFSFSCILTPHRNKHGITSIQLECDLMPYNRSGMESSADKYTTDLTSDEIENEPSTLKTLVSEEIMYLTVKMRTNNIPNTDVPYTNRIIVHKTGEHSELDVADNFFDIVDTTHQLNMDKQTTESVFDLTTDLNEVSSMANNDSTERTSVSEVNVTISSYRLDIKVLWINYIMKNKLTENSFKITSQRVIDNSICLCHHEENRMLCFGERIQLNLCRCHLHNYPYGGNTLTKLHLMYIFITVMLVVIGVAAVLTIIYRKVKVSGEEQMAIAYEMD